MPVRLANTKNMFWFYRKQKTREAGGKMRTVVYFKILFNDPGESGRRKARPKSRGIERQPWVDLEINLGIQAVASRGSVPGSFEEYREAVQCWPNDRFPVPRLISR